MPTVDELFEQATAAHRAGDVGRAEEIYRSIIQQNAAHAPSYCNLGVVLVQQGRTDEGIANYQQALRLNPQYAEAHFNLGNAYRRLGRIAESIGCYRTAIRFMPNVSAFSQNLGVAYSAMGRWQEATDAFAQAVRLDPAAPAPLLRYADGLHKLGRFDDAITQARTYLRMQPTDSAGHHLLALSLASAGRIDEAIVSCQKAVQIKPDYAEAQNSLGVFYESNGRQEEALAQYQKAVALNPRFPEALNNLGTAALELGMQAESIHYRQAALELQPHASHFFSNLLLALEYPVQVTPEQRFEAHREWGKRYADALAPPVAPRPRDPDPERRLRVGYLSSDFREHTVAAFLEPLLAAHSHERFHVSCFSNVARPDAVTERIRARADSWHVITRMKDQDAADLIRRENIDILIETNGHTAGNRLLLLARKPAPLLVTVFGYPDTTGLNTVDYRITDFHSDPSEATDRFYTETLWRLPEVSWCYQPPANSPGVGLPPADTLGFITFGSLNNLAKVTPEMIALWAKVLKRVERSKLILMAGNAAAGAKRLRELFAQHGIGDDRLELMPRLPKVEYLQKHNAIDLYLDPHPYNGGVTSCDALWMGCPLLTLAGSSYPSRQGVTLLTTLGLTELIVPIQDEYVETAVRWAGQLEKLREIRLGLRERMRQSPIVDAQRYARHFETALRDMWRGLVAG